nr:efflux RND transporter permease subunit [Nitritalea halalkaliphila]
MLEGCKEIVTPKLLILFSILAVFAPAFFMSGVPKGMFLPMSLAVGFAMIASFLISMTLVPVLAVWLMKAHGPEAESPRFNRFRERYLHRLQTFDKHHVRTLSLYFLLAAGLFIGGFALIGLDIFPKVDAGQAVVRLRLDTGTRLERTEEATQKLLALAEEVVALEISTSARPLSVRSLLAFRST